MKLSKIFTLIFVAFAFSGLLEAKSSSSKHYVGHATLFGMKEGIYVKFKNPILVKTLQKDSKGYFYTNSDQVFMPKGLFSWLHKNKKKKNRVYKCFCLVCKPTTFFTKQDEFMKHMNEDYHFSLSK